MQAAGPSISQGRRIDERFTRTRSIFFCQSGRRAAHLGSARGGSRVTEARQLAKFCAPVRPAGCLVGAWSSSLVSQVVVLRRREYTFWRM